VRQLTWNCYNAQTENLSLILHRLVSTFYKSVVTSIPPTSTFPAMHVTHRLLALRVNNKKLSYRSLKYICNSDMACSLGCKNRVLNIIWACSFILPKMYWNYTQTLRHSYQGNLGVTVFLRLPACWLVACLHLEGPATSHLDTGFLGSSLSSTNAEMVPKFKVTIACFSFSPPDFNSSKLPPCCGSLSFNHFKMA
jgi:hypothetical protein